MLLASAPALAAPLLRRRQHRCAGARRPVASSATTDTDDAALTAQVGALVAWCVERGASGSGLSVSLHGCGRGRGLVASRPIADGETLLTLPLALGVADAPDGHPAVVPRAALAAVPWFARLAARLLQERAAGEASPWAPYLALLPRRVPLPLLRAADARLSALLVRYPPLADEAAEMAAAADAAYDTLARDAPAALAGASRRDYLDAVSVVYSRAYGLSMRTAGAGGGQAGVFRTLLPLADMLNHGGPEGGAPPAALFPPVRCAANVAWDVQPLDDDDGYALQVRATCNIDADTEALFDYRADQGNDHFLLYYGFVPPHNASDDVVLWPSLDAALSWWRNVHADAPDRRATARADVARLEAAVAAGSDRGLLATEPRLKVLAGTRLDGRLVAAFTALHGGEAPDAVAAAHADVRRRCAEVLAQLGDDDASEGDDATAAAALLLLANKRCILREALAALA